MRVIRWMVCVVMMVGARPLQAQAVRYELAYGAVGDASVAVRIELADARQGPATLVFPRNYPGRYGLVMYDQFVENVQAFAPDGTALAVKPERFGPRWTLGAKGQMVARVEYRVNLQRMERDIHDAVDTSKVRPGYVGLFGYSVFGYVDGEEGKSIGLRVRAPAQWPVFSTQDAKVPAAMGTTTVAAANFSELADSEILMGPELHLQQFDGAIKLVMAVYSEGTSGTPVDARLARQALAAVQRYFGDTPFPAYTVELEILKPQPGHDYEFSQEHRNSGTFIHSTEEAPTEKTPANELNLYLLNYGHHMAHSWIPKRAYGEGYFPTLWEMPPTIDTIWVNEGFGRYVGIAAITDEMKAEEGEALRQSELKWMRGLVQSAPEFIQRMPTSTLSREASFMYAEDFRTGLNVFSRGSLMAAEMDDLIREKSKGKKSLRDGLRAVLARMEKDPRPLQMETELPALIASGTGVDVRAVMEKWLAPQKR